MGIGYGQTECYFPTCTKPCSLSATFMKPLKTTIILLLTCVTCVGQKSSSDTFLTRQDQMSATVNDNDFLTAAKGVEVYLKSLLSDTIYDSHIQLNWEKSNKAAFEVRLGDTFNSKVLERHTYYNIHYYLLDKGDTLSYFDLLVDSTGKPTSYDKDFAFSSPTNLILSFRNLFPNKFKIGFAKAVAIGQQHGFDTKPFLNCATSNKQGVYWSFSKKYPGGKRKLMNINAKTGAIKEFYMPVLEQ